MKTVIISDKPYGKWLSESLLELDKMNIESFAIIGITDKHETVTEYYNCGVSDKAVMATNIHADALYDTVIANANQIVKAAKEQNEDDEEQDE